MSDIERIGEYPPKGCGVQYLCHDCHQYVEGFQHHCKRKIYYKVVSGVDWVLYSMMKSWVEVANANECGMCDSAYLSELKQRLIDCDFIEVI